MQLIASNALQGETEIELVEYVVTTRMCRSHATRAKRARLTVQAPKEGSNNSYASGYHN